MCISVTFIHHQTRDITKLGSMSKSTVFDQKWRNCHFSIASLNFEHFDITYNGDFEPHVQTSGNAPASMLFNFIAQVLGAFVFFRFVILAISRTQQNEEAVFSFAG